jgi:hypothetical protein
MITIPILAMMSPMFAAIGFSFLYLLLGGGFFGAVVIFFVARAFGK